MIRYNKALAQNTLMMVIINAVKIFSPLLILPFLTRRLSIEGYALVSYAQTTMAFFAGFIEFGFIISATRDVVEHRGKNEVIGGIFIRVQCAKMLLSLCAFLILVFMAISVPIIRDSLLYITIAFLATMLTSFFPDFLFRGLERMAIPTLCLAVTKMASIIAIFLFVKSDKQVLLVPSLELVSSFLIVAISLVFVKRNGIPLRVRSTFRSVWGDLVRSLHYFITTTSAKTISVITTYFIGLYLTVDEIAYWGFSMNLIMGIVSFYTAIANGIFPHMIKHRNLGIIKRLIIFLFPIVILGSAFCFIFAKPILVIVGGVKYMHAVTVFRYLVPMLVFTFPSVIFTYPVISVFGGIIHIRNTSLFTVAFNLVFVLLLIFTGWFTLYTVALVRVVTTMLTLTIRLYEFWRYAKGSASESKAWKRGYNVSESIYPLIG